MYLHIPKATIIQTNIKNIFIQVVTEIQSDINEQLWNMQHTLVG